MIVFLVGINIFLLAFLSLTTFQRSVVPKSVIDASVKILEKEDLMRYNISIDLK